MICAVINQDKILLASSTRFKSSFYSVLAGFVEPGETLEECVAREVKEETSLDIRLGRPIGFYSKPAENGLAVTFEGFLLGGELHPDHEIRAAAYFPLDALPENIRPHLRQRVADYTAAVPYTIYRNQ